MRGSKREKRGKNRKGNEKRKGMTGAGTGIACAGRVVQLTLNLIRVQVCGRSQDSVLRSQR
jgi:hypothetical protein